MERREGARRDFERPLWRDSPQLFFDAITKKRP
jgi:hypothetical protein